MSFVLDASLALAWSFDDEPEPDAPLGLDLLSGDHAVVPSVWPLELSNALVIAERQGRITRSDSARLTSLLGGFPIEVEPITTRRALGDVLDIARDYELSAYDAAYLEVAVRRALPLATLDGRLRTAAERVGAQVVG